MVGTRLRSILANTLAARVAGECRRQRIGGLTTVLRIYPIGAPALAKPILPSPQVGQTQEQVLTPLNSYFILPVYF